MSIFKRFFLEREARELERAADKITVRYAREGCPVRPEDMASWKSFIDRGIQLRRLAKRS